MTGAAFELRAYQREALLSFRRYLQKTVAMAEAAEHPARAAFNDATGFNFAPAPLVDPQTPFVCIRIPTGGGKTLVAAHSVGIAAKEFMQADNPMVLWLVPSTAILDQTLSALRNPEHPYRAALTAEFGRNLSVLTVAEALALSRPDATGGACIIVATLQAFRAEDTAGRKVYQDAGALMDHFSGLRPEDVARLEAVEGNARPVASLCNVLRLHRPMVIVDEAHNARTVLSFETLSRFAPSLILELTATPQLERDVAKDIHPSNVLFHVSAAELKAEEMIKLPIRLNTDADWQKTVGQALDCQAELERAAEAEQAETGEYIRPIVLFHAQARSKTDPDRLTPERVVQFLVDDRRIPRTQIAIHATGHAELDNIADIASPDCPVRYIVTVQKLREGWDCPFAYVLCSVAELSSPTAVEQLLGRVMRMPKARRKSRDVLNRAYAFVASRDFQVVAGRLRDGLVNGAGFERLEAEQLVKAHGDFNFAEDQADFEHKSEALPDEPEAGEAAIASAIASLPASLKQRIAFEPETRTFSVRRPLSRFERNTMQIAFTKVPGAERVIDRLFISSNRIQATELPEGVKPPFIVPRLGLHRQGELELLGPDHFLDMPWNLAECDPTPFAERFALRDGTSTGEIDVSTRGRVNVSFVDRVHDQLAMAIHEPAWTLPRLVNWIDRGIPHPDITKPAARVFIQRALEAVIKAGSYSLERLARHKYEVRRALAEEIKSLREGRKRPASPLCRVC